MESGFRLRWRCHAGVTSTNRDFREAAGDATNSGVGTATAVVLSARMTARFSRTLTNKHLGHEFQYQTVSSRLTGPAARNELRMASPSPNEFASARTQLAARPRWASAAAWSATRWDNSHAVA